MRIARLSIIVAALVGAFFLGRGTNRNAVSPPSDEQSITLVSAEEEPASESGDSAAPAEDPEAADDDEETVAGPTEPPGLRDLERMVFDGVETFAPDDIRAALSFDHTVFLAAHPARDPFEFFGVIEDGLLCGYQSRGFSDAEVETLYNHTRDRLEVRVREGSRYRCGQVRVEGAVTASIEELNRSIVDAELKLWKKGEPVPFDRFTRRVLRGQLETGFVTCGLVAPEFGIDIERNDETKTADLVVTIRSEGPRAVLGAIDVSGSERDSPEEVIAYLDLREGMPYDGRVLQRAQARLYESGRYLSIAVQEIPRASSESEGVLIRDLAIRLLDYDEATPIAKKLAPAEDALLKLGEWLERWGRGETEDDLVITASLRARDVVDVVASMIGFPSPDSSPADTHTKLVVTTTINPRTGQTISLSAQSESGAPMIDVKCAALSGRLVLADALRRTKAELAIDPHFSIGFNVEASAIPEAEQQRESEEGDEEEEKHERFRLMFGLGWKNSSETRPPFFVKTRFSPVCMISMATQSDAQSTLSDGIWTIATKTFEVRFEAATGKLLALHGSDEEILGAEFDVQTASGALEAQRQGLESLFAASTEYDPSSMWKSLLLLGIDQWIAVAAQSDWRDQAEGLTALRKLFDRWTPPPVHDLLAAFYWAEARPEEPFSLPSAQVAWLQGRQSEAYLDFVTTRVLRVYRHVAPKSGWMWPVGRDAALYWRTRDDAVGWSLIRQASSPEIGPVGEAVVGILTSMLGMESGETAGHAGLKRLSAAAFARDYRPLLEGDSWLGRFILSLASAAGSLDEGETQALVRLLPEGMAREVTLFKLLKLGSQPDQPIAWRVSGLFDDAWTTLLHPVFEAFFTSMTRPDDTSPESAEPRRDDQVHPAAAETASNPAAAGTNERDRR